MNDLNLGPYEIMQWRHAKQKLLSQVGTVPGNMAYFGGYELGKLIVPGKSCSLQIVLVWIFHTDT
jgi:hypothetical protein